jgi:regulator of sigma E protease
MIGGLMALLAWFIVPLLLLVAVPHELGHLLVARRFGVTVREFGIGLPPRAGSFIWRGICWSVNWLLPFGAFVKLKGEDVGTEADDFAALSAGRRSLVVLAGPAANLLVAALALLLSTVVIGEPVGLRAVVGQVEPLSAGAQAGLQSGDVVVAIDGQVVRTAGPALAALVGDGPVVLEVDRGGERVHATLASTDGLDVRERMRYAPVRSPEGLLHALLPLAAASQGVAPSDEPGVPSDWIELRRTSPAGTGGLPTAMLGWVGLAQVMQELDNVGIPPLGWFLALLASLSIGLGVMNLLPLPPLDGGRVGLYALEALRRGPALGPRVMTRLNVAGFMVLVLFFAAVTGTDVWRVLSGQSILTVH